MDLLAELYSSWSPHVNTVNNPALFVDPNGKWINIYGRDGTEYRYENGEMKKQNDEGDWVNVGYYFGGDDYVADIYNNLLKIAAGDENSFGSKYLALFNNDETNVKIKENTIKDDRNKGKNFHLDGEVYTDFNQKETSKYYHLLLFHEISHGFSYAKNFSGRADE